MILAAEFEGPRLCSPAMESPSHFVPEGLKFLTSPVVGLPFWLEIVFIVLCFAVGWLFLYLLTRQTQRGHLKWKVAAFLIAMTYLTASIGFGLWYHMLFQLDPHNFAIST